MVINCRGRYLALVPDRKSLPEVLNGETIFLCVGQSLPLLKMQVRRKLQSCSWVVLQAYLADGLINPIHASSILGTPSPGW